MRTYFFAASVLFALAWPSAGMAQLTCATPAGNCTIGTGVPGAQCYCVTPNGPIIGTVSVSSFAPSDTFPNYCCTPAGRFGPYPNSGLLAGQPCQASLPNGSMMQG